MIAGIVAFVAVATSVAFGSPCGVVSNGCAGNLGFVNSGLNGGLLAGGLNNGYGYSGCGLRSSGYGLASSVVAVPSVVATPAVVATPISTGCGACGLQAPVTSSVNSVVGNAREVVATEAVAPEYSTLVTPTVSNIGSSCGSLVSGVSNIGSSCGSLVSGVSNIGSSCGSLVSGVSNIGSYGLSNGIVSSGLCGSELSTGVLGTSSGILSAGNYGCNRLSTGIISSGIVSSPVTSVCSSPVATVVAAPRVYSTCGSTGPCNSGSRTVISAPIVEPTNVAVPIVSRVSGVCGSSFNGCGNGVCGC